MDVKTIIEWLGYVFAVIGFGATIYKSMAVWLSLRTFSWSDVDKYIKVIIKKMEDDFYIPDVVVTIGRGGAITGALLSGNMRVPSHQKDRNIPFLGIDRVYEWRDGVRVEVKNKMVDYTPLKGKKVLLVASDILTGGTMKFYHNEISKVNPEEIRVACLVKGVTATFQPNYYGKEIPADFSMPWMYKGFGYARDSRKPSKKG